MLRYYSKNLTLFFIVFCVLLFSSCSFSESVPLKFSETYEIELTENTLFKNRMEKISHTHRYFLSEEAKKEIKDRAKDDNYIALEAHIAFDFDDIHDISFALLNGEDKNTALVFADDLKKSKIAAGKLNVSYENYNRSVLLEKAREYSNDLKQLKMFEDKEKTIVHITEELQKKMHEQKEIEQEKELEQEKLEKQKQELDKNDVSQLMKQQVELQDKIAKKQRMISDKEKQVEKKEDSYKETEGKQKDYLQKKELAVDEIEDKFLEMDEIFQILSFDEHSFMKDELQKSLDQVYSFDTILQQVSNMKEHVVQGIEILEKEKTESQKYEDLQVKHYNEEKVKKQLEREQIVLQEQEAQVKSEWIEKFYQWNRKNKELTLLEEMQQRIVTEIETFTQEKDFSDVKDLVRKERNRKEQEVKTTLFDAERQQKEQQEQVTILETTLQDEMRLCRKIENG